MYLCDSYYTHINTGRGGAVTRPKKSVQHATQAFHKDSYIK